MTFSISFSSFFNTFAVLQLVSLLISISPIVTAKPLGPRDDTRTFHDNPCPDPSPAILKLLPEAMQRDLPADWCRIAFQKPQPKINPEDLDCTTLINPDYREEEANGLPFRELPQGCENYRPKSAERR